MACSFKQARVKLPAGRTWEAVRPAGFYFCLLWEWDAAYGKAAENRTVRFDGGTKKKKLGQKLAGPGTQLRCLGAEQI